jgi:drug/metabolite transporter (DMT)-like permease
MAYNVSWMNNVTNFAQLTTGINTATSNGLSIVIMLTIFIITYASTSKYGSTSAMIASGLVTTIFGLLLWLLGVTGLGIVIGAPIVILIFAVAVSFFNR